MSDITGVITDKGIVLGRLRLFGRDIVSVKLAMLGTVECPAPSDSGIQPGDTVTVTMEIKKP